MKVGTNKLEHGDTSYQDLESRRHTKIMLMLCTELGLQTKDGEVPVKVKHLFGRIPTSHLVSGLVKMAYQRGLSRRQMCHKFSLTMDEVRRIVDRIRAADKALTKK